MWINPRAYRDLGDISREIDSVYIPSAHFRNRATNKHRTVVESAESAYTVYVSRQKHTSFCLRTSGSYFRRTGRHSGPLSLLRPRGALINSTSIITSPAWRESPTHVPASFSLVILPKHLTKSLLDLRVECLGYLHWISSKRKFAAFAHLPRPSVSHRWLTTSTSAPCESK